MQLSFSNIDTMKKGDTVHWAWGKSEAEGKIEAKHSDTVKKKTKGTTVKRKATKEEPAYEIKQENGTKVLKSESELKKGRKK
ncbi:hypothetical protein QE417_001579 [Mucilaginibacter terrae]|uniref:Hypervirulence associated protein TUDOR domain-containing protein n=2 Tax=Mucilaginibacter terrae TaxID=1955052 RepID=A0ABU3GRW1_9SPHI|nr:hypothetical protein [Mucilaginibacter terrae]